MTTHANELSLNELDHVSAGKAIPVWPDEYLLAVEFIRAESLSAPKHKPVPFCDAGVCSPYRG